jgi:hypothetical protein
VRKGYTICCKNGVYELHRTGYPYIGVFKSDWGTGCDDFTDRAKALKAARRWCRNCLCKLKVEC